LGKSVAVHGGRGLGEVDVVVEAWCYRKEVTYESHRERALIVTAGLGIGGRRQPKRHYRRSDGNDDGSFRCVHVPPPDRYGPLSGVKCQ